MILVDCGTIFHYRGQGSKLKTEVTLEAMNLMGYDALNLGSQEFLLGLDFLRAMSAKFSPPFVSSNLVYENGDPIPWAKKSIIKDVNGLKVAFLGIIPPDAFNKISDTSHIKNLKIIPPEKALNDLLPDVKKKADLLILLSQCGLKATTSIVNSLSGIDLAISCGSQKLKHGYNHGFVPVLQTGSKGKQLGRIQVTKSATGKISIGQGALIELDDSVPSDSQIDEIVKNTSSKISRERKKLKQEKKRHELHKELMEGLKQTPEKFFQMEQQRRTRKNTGECK